jgi:site-specific recombinase XerD
VTETDTIPKDDAAPKERRAKGDGGLHFDPKRGLHIGTVWVTGDDGVRRQRRVSSKKESEALRKLNKLRADLLNGKLPDKVGKTLTVGEWLDEWLKIKKREVRPKTYISCELSVRLYLKPLIGHHKLDKLTTAHVRAMLVQLQDKGTADAKPSTRSAQKAHQALKSALDQAVSERRLEWNVCDAIKKRPKHMKKDRGVFETGTAAHILKTAAARDDENNPKRPKLASRWVAAFMTGARQAECLGLELNRVDFKRGVIDVSWQLQRLKYAHGCGVNADGEPKCGRVRTGYCPAKKTDFPPGFETRHCHRSLFWTRPKSLASGREIPMAPLLAESLKVHMRLDKDPNPHGLVWHHRDGRPLSQEDDNQQWNMLMVASGVEKLAGEAVLHEARNTTATILLEWGVDVKIIQSIMGHATILQTQDYQRVSLELGKSAVATAFDALLPPA